MEMPELQTSEGQGTPPKAAEPKASAASVIKSLAILVAVIAFAALVLSVLHIGCPIKFATGLSCPGCGMFRAWMAFFTLHPLEALVYHPLFWTVPIALVAAVLLQEGVLEGKVKIICTAIIVVLLVLLVGLWIFRLIFYPDSTLLFDTLDGASYPADIIGWNTPVWLEWLQGLFWV